MHKRFRMRANLECCRVRAKRNESARLLEISHLRNRLRQADLLIEGVLPPIPRLIRSGSHAGMLAGV